MISDDSSWLFSCLQTPMDISEIRWLSVWCTRFTVNFAEIFIPHDPKVPRRLFLERFPQLHQASLEKLRSDPIQILDDRSFLIPAFYLYTGGDKGYRFQASLRASPDKFNVDIPNENNRYDDLVDYNGRDIIIVLPTSTTMYDIAGLAVRDVVRERVLGWISVPSVGELETHPIPPSLGQNTHWWPDTSPPSEEDNFKWRVPFRLPKTIHNFEVRLGPPGGEKVRYAKLAVTRDFDLTMPCFPGLQGDYGRGPALYRDVLVDQWAAAAGAHCGQGRDLLLQGEIKTKGFFGSVRS